MDVLLYRVIIRESWLCYDVRHLITNSWSTAPMYKNYFHNHVHNSKKNHCQCSTWFVLFRRYRVSSTLSFTNEHLVLQVSDIPSPGMYSVSAWTWRCLLWHESIDSVSWAFLDPLNFLRPFLTKHKCIANIIVNSNPNESNRISPYTRKILMMDTKIGSATRRKNGSISLNAFLCFFFVAAVFTHRLYPQALPHSGTSASTVNTTFANIGRQNTTYTCTQPLWSEVCAGSRMLLVSLQSQNREQLGQSRKDHICM